MSLLRDHRGVLAGTLLLAAGAYILISPLRPSPGECMFGGIVLRGLYGLDVCVQSSALPTVIGLATGLGLAAIGLWYVFSDRLPARLADALLATMLMAILAWSTAALVMSPTGPGKTSPGRSETAAPQIRVP